MDDISQFLRTRIAHNLREIRKGRGLTQETLAYQAGIATRHLQKIEAAEVNLTLETIAKLSLALNIDPAGFFKETLP